MQMFYATPLRMPCWVLPGCRTSATGFRRAILPLISPYLEQMKGALGTALGISPVRVGIKATTNEQLGALGRREGIAAFAVAAILMPEDLAMP